jgi:hypothetical protein
MAARRVFDNFALSSLDCELLGEPVALLRGDAGHPERHPPTSGPGDADDDEARTDEHYDNCDDASNDKPAGADDDCSAEHVNVDARRILDEHVNREADGRGHEQ